ncbi:hypothetical protein Ndes2526B_g09184 [Nannochloris sp. 'desiccata']
MRIVLPIIVLLAFICGFVQSRASPKGVKISLAAKWPATPLLHEAAEFLADESPELFWKFSRGWKAPTEQGAAECSTAITEQASCLLTPAMGEIFRVSLTARQYSPRLETFRQIATANGGAAVPSDACCWATVGNQMVTDSSKIDASVQEGLRTATHASTLMPFDHMYSSRSGGGKAVNISDPNLLPVVLYGPVGSTCATEMDAILSAAAEKDSRVVYAWRPVLSEACSTTEIDACGALGTKGTLNLHGYGVELAIKNMEYNARDDSKAAPEVEAEEEDETDTTFEKTASTLGEEDGSSLQFKTLLERTPELRQELLAFRDHLLAAASQEQALNIKDLKDLGLQATRRIVSASDPLHLLGEVAQNFPLMVETLSKGDVSDDLRTAAGMLNQKLPPQNQFLLVNGIPYETNDFNLYDFIDTLRQEVRLMDTLAAAGLAPLAAREAAILRGTPGTAAAASVSGGGATRLDLLPSADNNEVVWVNDLEKDQAYKNLPKALMGLLQPGFMGQAPAVRRNVFNVLLAIDPAAPHGMDAALAVQNMVQQRWPVRLGIMPVQTTIRDTDSEKTAMLFSAIAAVHGGPAAVEFLVRCGSGIDATDMQLDDAEYAVKLLPVAEKTFEAFWKDLAKGKGAHSVSSASDDEYADDYEDDTNSSINPEKKALAKIKPVDALQQVLHATGDIGTAARKFLSTSTALIAHKGLTPTVISGGALVFNGIVSSVQENGGWRGSIGATWQSEMQRVAQDIYLGRLSDDSDDIYQDILRLRDTLPRYNLRVMASAPKSKRSFKLHAGSDEVEGEAPRQVVLAGPDVGLEAISNLPVQYFVGDVAADSSSSSSSGKNPRKSSDPSAFSDDDYSDLDGNNEEDDEQEDNVDSASASATRLVTHWVVIDPTTPSGLQLASDALQYESSVSRIGILVNPRDNNNNNLLPVEELVVAVAAGFGQSRKSASRADLIDLFAELATIDNVSELTFDQLTKQLPESLSALKGGAAALVEPVRSDITAAIGKYKLFIQQGLSIPPGQNAVVTNGRIVYARFLGDVVEEDFQLMDIGAVQHQFASQKALGKILSRSASLTNIKNTDEDEEQQHHRTLSDIAVVVSSVLIAYQPDELTINVKVLMGMIEEEERKNSPLFISTTSMKSSSSSSSSSSSRSCSSPLRIQAILNPLTKTTQQFSAIFTALRTSIDPDIHVLLNPVMEYSEMPLKTFYRFVVPIVDTLAPMESNLNSISALFATLPLHKTLTLGMDVPEGWLVEPVAAAHDLDNLRLDELEASERYATAGFELEALMVYGMCVDEGAVIARDYDSVHPRGVQLQLGTSTNPALVDTLVMSNLGYFQMKAGPGVWSLRLAPGRSQELYTISGSNAADGGGKGGARGRSGDTAAPSIVRPSFSGTTEKFVSVPVAVTGFGDSDVLLVLHKDPTRRHEDVLDADSGTVTKGNGNGSSSSSMWSKVTRAVSRERSRDDSDSDDDTIHVFTVASGHMYERLQKIMILSAIKRTKNRVKFWFIKNYMSPTMKEFVPIMAKQYGFDYEFVTYKWPSWLHKQTEKQRIIWAYKILFLDVLFPLNLKKVIFCDSDQVIRADLKDLWNMDLQGAPYGYTPFCDTNTDMEGFRFWKQGFWKDHLHGRPYHISALYVVNLERFRALAAGDRLRVIYDGLSKDPNSLSNLDQDLPNYAQDTVPIFSLPQEWLWCETWCGEATRPAARTIDLCNNPLTKEPKLQSARRIIAEWPDLNREAEEFTAAVEAVLEGRMSEQQLTDDNGSRFMTYLEPMVEGSVKTTGGGSINEENEAAPAHDATEL